MTISEGELEIMLQRVAGNGYRKVKQGTSPELMKSLSILMDVPVKSLKPKPKARGVHRPGVMNKTERAYADHLELRKQAGEIDSYWFEAVTFKIGPDCRYTPDFLVMMPDGALECHETKQTRTEKGTGKEFAFAEDDSKVKVRVAAGMFPHRFAILFRSKVRGWVEVEI